MAAIPRPDDVDASPEPSDQFPPTTIRERARFLMRRYCQYRDGFFDAVGLLGVTPPFTEKQVRLKHRFEDLADRLAYDDLQALLGRPGNIHTAIVAELAARGREILP